eukprot:GHVS01062059.1.p1 GENE.GHVS01062059.1~~GHVS01062059.1.p1  ORF type:complete len:166 (-),score=69.89 GHVS01062059.1:490-987(-)
MPVGEENEIGSDGEYEEEGSLCGNNDSAGEWITATDGTGIVIHDGYEGQESGSQSTGGKGGRSFKNSATTTTFSLKQQHDGSGSTSGGSSNGSSSSSRRAIRADRHHHGSPRRDVGFVERRLTDGMMLFDMVSGDYMEDLKEALDEADVYNGMCCGGGSGGKKRC